MDQNTNDVPATRDEIIAELGRVNGLLDCLAALVMRHDVRAARSMAEAMRGGEVDAAAKLDLGDERPKLTGWVVQHLAMMFAQHLDEMGALNHCAWTVHFPEFGEKPARDLDLVAQWSGGVTTADRMGRAERERDALRNATRAVAAAQIGHDRDPGEGTRGALDAALTALFALVPAEGEGA
jgi:hypothetical protein